MIDHILALLSLIGLFAFLAVVVWFLKEVDLTIVAVGVFGLALYDFFGNRLRSRRDPRS